MFVLPCVARVMMAVVIGLVLEGADADEPVRRALDEGRYAEAESLARAQLGQVEALSGADALEVADALELLIEALRSGGKSGQPEARALAERQLGILETHHGANGVGVARGLISLASVLDYSGRPDEARPLYERALGLLENAHGPEHPQVAHGLSKLGRLEVRSGDYDKARSLLEQAARIVEQAYGPDHPDLGRMLTGLGTVQVKTGELEDARRSLERAADTLHQALGAEHPDTAIARVNLATALMYSGDYAGARALLERASLILERQLSPDHPWVAKSANNLGNLLTIIGDYDGARPLLERAIAAQEKSPGSGHDLVYSLNNLANVCAKTGDLQRAAELYGRAVAILEEVYGPGHVDIAPPLNNLAAVSIETGDYVTAEAALRRALTIAEEDLGPVHPTIAGLLGTLGTVKFRLGDLESARDHLERSRRMQERIFGPDDPQIMATLTNLGAVLSEIGDVEMARAVNERSLTIAEAFFGSDHPELVAPLVNLANVAWNAGDYTHARRWFEQALSITETSFGPQHPTLAILVGNLAMLLTETGDHLAARTQFQRALELQEQMLGSRHPEIAIILDNLALAHRRIGEPSKALGLSLRALEIREQALGTDHPAYARGLINYAGLLTEMKDYPAAHEAAVRAATLLGESLGPRHPDTARALINIGALPAIQGRPAEALPHLREALAILEARLADHPDVADLHLNLAEVLDAAGDRGGALDHALRAEQIGRDHFLAVARGLSERRALTYAAARPRGLDLALRSADRLSAADLWRVWDEVVRSRALVLDEMARRHRAVLLSENPPSVALYQELQRRRKRLADLFVRHTADTGASNFPELLAEARVARARSACSLADVSAAFADERNRRLAGLRDVEAAMPADSTLVAYVVQDQRRNLLRDVEPSYWALVLRKGVPKPAAIRLGTVARINRLIAGWSRAVRETAGIERPEAEASYREIGASLRREIWDPLIPHVKDSRLVLVVPDGAIHLVAFSALPLGRNRYLIEDGPEIAYLSAERDVIPPTEIGGEASGLLALGGCEFDDPSSFAALAPPPDASGVQADSRLPIPSSAARGDPRTAVFRGVPSGCEAWSRWRFGELDATQLEVRELSDVWRGSRSSAPVLLLVGPEANETRFKQEVSSHRVVHLATHGFFLGSECQSALRSGSRGIGGLVPEARRTLPIVPGENPMLLSGIVLSGANHRHAAGPEEDDGILTAEEVASLDLRGVEWVVLSACDTGVGEVEVGEGVLGLRRAFEVAGARRLIMSLWPVDDVATRHWMRSLYQARLNGGMSVVAAVRSAGLELLESRRQRGVSTHPFFWSAFVAAGDWR